MPYEQNIFSSHDYFHQPNSCGTAALYCVSVVFFLNLGTGSVVRLNPTALEKEMEAFRAVFINRVI